VRLQVLVVGVVVGDVFLDRDVRVRLLVLLVELLVPEVAEQVDGQRDLLVAVGRAAVRRAPAGGERGQREQRADAQ
jgi:hypothetical protein